MEAIWEVLSNAFMQALVPSVDHQININSVEAVEAKKKRTLIQKIFGSGKKDKEEEKNDKK